MVEFKRKSLELLYDAKIVALYKDVLETPDGGEVVYDLIKHKSGGGAGILLVDEEEYTYLVRQYRNSLDAVDLEISAGGYSFHGESGETCALREAEEETGWIPQDIYHVSNMISSVGTFEDGCLYWTQSEERQAAFRSDGIYRDCSSTYGRSTRDDLFG